MCNSYILITTTRHTTPRTRALVKELVFSIDHIIKINRGKMSILDLFYRAKQLNCSRVIIVGRGLHGNPGRITFLMTDRSKPVFYPLILKLSGIKLAREMGVSLRSQPRKTVPVVVSNTSRERSEILEFAQELAAAINRPFLEVDYNTLKEDFENVILVKRSKKAKHCVSIYSLRDDKVTGPTILVEKTVYLSLPIEY